MDYYVSSGVVSSGVSLVDDRMYVYSSGTALSTMVSSLGTLIVSSGGSASGVTVTSYGWVGVSGGAVVSDLVMAGGSCLIRGAVHGAVASGRSVFVESGGSIVSARLEDGFLIVNNNGFASAASLYGGYMNISSGGSANGVTVEQGGRLTVSTGGSAVEIRENGGWVSSAAGAAVTFVEHTISGVAISGSATLHTPTVLQSASVISGGAVYLAGGSANAVTLESGALFVASGGRADELEVASGGKIELNVATDASFELAGNSAGTEFSVSASNGTITDYVVNCGWKVTFSSGASGARITENGGAVVIANGADVTIAANSFGNIAINRSATVHSGTVAEHVTVNNGGVLSVYSGGSATSVVENGGRVYVAEGASVTFTPNTVSGVTVKTGDGATVHAGTTMEDVTINHFAYVHVSSGGVVSGATLNPGGALHLSGDGATALEVRENGGLVLIYGSANVTFVPNTFSGITVSPLMYATVHSGTVALNNTLPAYTRMYVYDGGLASNTILDCGSDAIATSDALHVSSGGVALDTDVRSLGSLCVYSGATADGASVTYGRVEIYDGGSANAVAVGKYGVVTVHGGASATNLKENGGWVHIEEGAAVTFVPNTFSNLVLSRGSTTLHSGTVAASTTVNFSGAIHVSSGGVANRTTVSSGGRLYVSSGGTATSTTMSSGYLYVYPGGRLTGAINIASGAVVSAYEGSIIDFDISELEKSESPLLNDVTRISGWGTYRITAADYQGGTYVLAGNTASFSGSVSLTVGGNTYANALSVGTSYTVGDNTFTLFRDANDDLCVSTTQEKLTSVSGSVKSDGNSTISIAGCRVRSLITGAAQDVEGDVVMSLALNSDASSPCNVYGGGNGVDVVGSVNISITAGAYTGMIYGGSRAASGEVSVGDTAITVSGITHSDNPKLLASGNSAWLLGGGAAVSGGSAASGNVNISISGATLGQVVGGAQAQDAGSVASVASVNISLQNCSISGDLFGGGYAYNGATSEVAGDVHITLYADEANFLYSYGTIFGGGANPSHGSVGGWSLVRGNSTITLTGDGDFYNLVELNGDGKVGGTVYGVKTLEFKDFTNEFAANAKNFDVIKFSGDTRMETASTLRAETLAFDLTGRTSDDDAFAEGISFVLNQAKTLEIELGNATGTLALLAIDESDVANATVNLYQYGELLGTFTYGGSYDGRSLAYADGILTLKA